MDHAVAVGVDALRILQRVGEERPAGLRAVEDEVVAVVDAEGGVPVVEHLVGLRPGRRVGLAARPGEEHEGHPQADHHEDDQGEPELAALAGTARATGAGRPSDLLRRRRLAHVRPSSFLVTRTARNRLRARRTRLAGPPRPLEGRRTAASAPRQLLEQRLVLGGDRRRRGPALDEPPAPLAHRPRFGGVGQEALEGVAERRLDRRAGPPGRPRRARRCGPPRCPRRRWPARAGRPRGSSTASTARWPWPGPA